MDSIVCEHRDAEKVGRACEHLLAKKTEPDGEYYLSQEHSRHFTGAGTDFVLLCPQCAELPDRGESFWQTVCDSCVQDLACGKRLGDSGAPQVVTRDSGLRLVSQVVSVRRSNIHVVVAEPLGRSGDSWLILTDSFELIEFDVSGNSALVLTTILELGLTTEQSLSIEVSRNGRFVAVTQTRGLHGVVFDRVKKRVTMRLTRGDYYPEHCNFSVAFFEHQNRQRLIHATDWNRLDVSDPEDGSLLTQREPTAYRQGDERPPHYLDYFHCGLAVSPDGEWVADNGWVWHPLGVATTWSLTRWLKDNIWEAEDGESNKALCSRGYYWDGPLCWIDNRTVAVWGLGEDDLVLVPGVRLFEVESGTEKSSFPGPTAGSCTNQQVGTLAFDRWLFSWLPTGSFSIWDINDGARLLMDFDFVPLGYNEGSKKFISQLPDGTIRLSRIEEEELPKS